MTSSGSAGQAETQQRRAPGTVPGQEARQVVSESMGNSTQRRGCVVCGQEFPGDVTICPADSTPLTPLTPEPDAGTVLAGRYEILGVIGDGGMGKVFKARHLLMRRNVAIKMLHPHLVSNASTLKRFQQEAEAASALNHPNILTVFDFGLTDQGQPYLVMDYLEGTNLASELEGNAHLDIGRFLPIFIQSAAALAHAHQKGVIHRDLKPGNIMLVEFDGQPDFVKIVDFGIAKLIPAEAGESRHLTQTGEVFGSPLYMSPEQCRGRELDLRTDVYSLGCVMYRSLTGRAPFLGGDLLECMYKQVNDTPADFQTVCPELNLPGQLESIVFKAMAKEPDDRHQTMGALREDLESFRASFAPAVVVPSPAAAFEPSGSQRFASSAAFPTGAGGADRASSEQNDTTGAPTSSLPAPGPAASAVAPGGPGAAGHEKTTEAAAVTGSSRSAIPRLAALLRGLSAGKLAVLVAALALAGAGLWFASSIKLDDGKLVLAGGGEFEQAMSAAQQAYDNGDLGAAMEKGASALAVAKSYGPGNPRVAQARTLLGMVYYSQGSYDQAKKELSLALTERKLVFGADSPEFAETAADLGRVLSAQGSFTEAGRLLNQSLTVRREKFGSSDLQVADSLSALADLSLRQQRSKAAVDYLTEALNIRQQKLGQDSPVVAASLNDLGQAYEMEGNLDEAEALYKQALSIWEAKLAPDNPSIANSLLCLAYLHLKKKDYAGAEPYIKRAISIQEKALGNGAPAVAKTRKLYADVERRLKHPQGGSFRSWLENGR